MYLFFTLLCLAFLIAVLVFWFNRRPRFSAALKGEISAQWRRLEAEPDRKKAVMEADKLLDFTLKKLNYRGSLGAKLKQAQSLFSNYDQLWQAHKLRNRLAHELDAEMSEKNGRQALASFKKGLEDLGMKL